MLRATALAIALAALPLASASGDDNAAQLALRAESLVDHWDGDRAQLDQARSAIEEAIKLEPANPHYRGVLAREILLAGTAEDGISHSALLQAHGILMRTALEMEPKDARVMAFLVRTRLDLGIGGHEVRYKARAEQLGTGDPWVQLALAQYFESEHDTAHQLQALQNAVDLGLPSRQELRKAYQVLVPAYALSGQRQMLDKAYAGRVQLDPEDAYVRGRMAHDLLVFFQDFDAAERIAREAVARVDYPQARQTLSLALYGEWAAAARDGKGADVIHALYRKASANDPGGHRLPTCLAEWRPLQFVYMRLEEKQITRQEMQQC